MSGINKDTIGSGWTLAAAAKFAGLHQRIEELELALATANALAVPVDSNLRMRQMLEACPIVIATLAQDDGRCLFANGTLVEMLGSGTREDFLAADFKTTWTDQSMMTEVWSAFVERRYVLNFEAERVRRDGSRWWVLLNTKPIVFEGVNAGIVWHVDISRRMGAVEAARESENRFREAVESLSDAFALFDPDDQLIFCNRVSRDLNPGLAANIRPGMTYADMVRDNLANGRIVAAAGREEEFVAQRMAQHRNPPTKPCSPRGPMADGCCCAKNGAPTAAPSWSIRISRN
jgi:PAS domain S-box-containing protein